MFNIMCLNGAIVHLSGCTGLNALNIETQACNASWKLVSVKFISHNSDSFFMLSQFYYLAIVAFLSLHLAVQFFSSLCSLTENNEENDER